MHHHIYVRLHQSSIDICSWTHIRYVHIDLSYHMYMQAIPGTMRILLQRRAAAGVANDLAPAGTHAAWPSLHGAGLDVPFRAASAPAEADNEAVSRMYVQSSVAGSMAPLLAAASTQLTGEAPKPGGILALRVWSLDPHYKQGTFNLKKASAISAHRCIPCTLQ